MSLLCKIRRLTRPSVRDFGISFLLILASACAQGPDTQVSQSQSYRQVNEECTGISLASASLSVPDFRKILACLNAHGALQPIQALAARLSDDELRPWVNAGNHYLLSQPRVFHQIETTFQTLGHRKVLDNTLFQLGRLLENDELVTSSLALAQDATQSDREVLKVLKLISEQMSETSVSELLSIGLQVFQSNAFISLQKQLNEKSRSGKKLKDLMDLLAAYLQDANDPARLDAGRLLLELVATGRLFDFLDDPRVLGTDPEQLKYRVPRLTAVLKTLFDDEGKTFDALTSLMHFGRQSVSCVKGSQTLAEPARFFMEELASRPLNESATFIKRTGPLIFMALGPLCDIPTELATLLPQVTRLADSSSIRPATELLQVMVEKGLLADLLVPMLSDTGSENTTGIKRLIPHLTELGDKDVWDDLLLLGSIFQAEDRATLQSYASLLLGKLPGSERTAWSVLAKSVSNIRPDRLYRFASSLSRLVEQDQILFSPALLSFRKAFFVNDAHPFIDIVREVLSDAEKDDELVLALFKVSEFPEFKASIRLISELSKDGRLKKVIQTLLTLFHKHSARSSAIVQDLKEPPTGQRSRHVLARVDLQGFQWFDEPFVGNRACSKFDLVQGLYTRSSSAYERNLDLFSSCMGSDSKHENSSRVFDFLRDQVTDQDLSYFDHTVALIQKLGFNSNDWTWISDRFFASQNDQSVFRLLGALPLLVHGTPSGSGSIVEPALGVLAAWNSAGPRAELGRLQSWAASHVRSDDFPLLVSDVERWSDAGSTLVLPSVSRLSFDAQRARRWIENKECGMTGEVDRRVIEVLEDATSAVSLSDQVQGRPRKVWSLPELKPRLEAVLNRIQSPQRDALLNIFRYFSLPKLGAPLTTSQHYTADELQNFLAYRAGDYRWVSYFADGETVPHVRYLSAMDRLELVLVNSDLWAPWPFLEDRLLPDFSNQRNFGLFFLNKIAEAWGDEPEEIWPDLIHKKYAGSRPPTLAEAVNEIMGWAQKFEALVGYPELPGCPQVANPTDSAEVQDQETRDPRAATGGLPSWLPGIKVAELQRSLYNIRQFLPVLVENLPLADQKAQRVLMPLGLKLPSPSSKMAGGLKVLRDILFELYASSAPEDRKADFHDPSLASRHSLSLMTDFVRLGLTRQATVLMRDTRVSAPSLQSFFRALVQGSGYQARRLIDSLLERKQLLFWVGVEGIFNAKTEAAKTLSFYSLAAAADLQIIPSAMASLAHTLSEHRSYWVKSSKKISDLLSSVLSSDRSAHFVRELSQDPDSLAKQRVARVMQSYFAEPKNLSGLVQLVRAVDENASSAQSWDLLFDRWGLWKKSDEVEALLLAEWSRGALDFFEEKMADPRAGAAARQMRGFLADALGDRSLDQYFALASRQPQGFFEIFQTLGTHVESGDLADLLKMTYRATHSAAYSATPSKK